MNRLPLGVDEFVRGVTQYFEPYVDDDVVRIVLKIYLVHQPEPIPAIVDTGAP